MFCGEKGGNADAACDGRSSPAALIRLKREKRERDKIVILKNIIQVLKDQYKKGKAVQRLYISQVSRITFKI